MTVQATLTHATAFGVVDVHERALVLRGSGDVPSRVLLPAGADAAACA